MPKGIDGGAPAGGPPCGACGSVAGGDERDFASEGGRPQRETEDLLDVPPTSGAQRPSTGRPSQMRRRK